MPLLQERDREEVRRRLSEMQEPVKLVYFTQELECAYCRETHQLLEEVTELSDKLSLEVYNFALDKEEVERYGIDKIPATVLLMGDKDVGIRFYGIPSGYEFATLLEDILMLSARDPGLAPETMAKLEALDRDLHIQVFVTPTCPYCPPAVNLAHRFAMASPHVRADMVEATEFPHLVQRYGVRGVPRTVVNEEHAIEGALPETHYVDAVLAAVEAKAS